jgi:teichuronic acid exporter
MLRQRALRALVWNGVDVFTRSLLGVLFNLALARLLLPEAFGTVAAVAIFMGVATAFADCGFSAALVQRQDIDDTDRSTVFWFNLGMGTLIAGGIFALAPSIAAFFDAPILVAVMRVLAFATLLSALGSVQRTFLIKRLDFRTQLRIGAIATILAGAIAVAMAWNGWGVWALVAQTLVVAFVTTTLLWIIVGFRPGFVFSLKSARRLFGFGGYIFASRLMFMAFSRAHTIVIGRAFTLTDLGLYERANSAQQMPVNLLSSLVSQVAFPVFAAAGGDLARVRRGLEPALRALLFVTIPAMMILSVMAEDVLRILFGRQWLPAAPILSVLALAGIFWPANVINTTAMQALGHSSLLFRLSLFKNVTAMLLLIAGSWFGLLGIAWANVVSTLIGTGVNFHYTARTTGYGVAPQLRDLLIFGLAGGLMAAAMLGVFAALERPRLLEMAAAAAVGGALYLAVLAAFLRKGMLDLITIVREAALRRPGPAPATDE